VVKDGAVAVIGYIDLNFDDLVRFDVQLGGCNSVLAARWSPHCSSSTLRRYRSVSFWMAPA
jgi:hypothetical protein